MPPVKVVVITVVMFAVCQLISMTGYGLKQRRTRRPLKLM